MDPPVSLIDERIVENIFPLWLVYLNLSANTRVLEKLRSAIEDQLESMVKRNKSRSNYYEKFQRLIDEYNSGSMNVDILFDRLIKFVSRS